jgi:hypothetical protein
MKITRDRDRDSNTLLLDQRQYIDRALHRFRMHDCHGSETPAAEAHLTKNESAVVDIQLKQIYQEAVGSLLYAAISTRPDIIQAVVQVSKFNSNPTREHWTAVKRIMRYLRQHPNIPLVFTGRSAGNMGQCLLDAYCDADWAGDHADRKSTSGVLVKFNGDPIVWQSKKQGAVALSTAEAEYYAITTAAQELKWIKQLLKEVLPHHASKSANKQNPVCTIYSDNRSAIQISSNNANHGRSKHIDIKYHFVRDDIVNNEYKLEWISSNDNPADMFTKPLGPIKFKNCRTKITGGC